MSGICGIVNLDGAPVDRQALRAMASAIAFRGPDRLDLRIEGAAGFAHSLLRTDPDGPEEVQPISIDGRTWIVADARIDAQEGLRRTLVARGRTGAESGGDAALILHAWHAWGEDCVRHLLGDFAFAIWDSSARRLFCARDHFGVKALFHARIGDCVVFSNTLDSVRAHPGVSDDLDDLAIADFLLFERTLEPGVTGFASIGRTPPASRTRFSKQGARTDCYWTPPSTSTIRFRREGDYAEAFRELLQAAVHERTRSSRVVVQMSGGLDSTAVGALARRALVARQRPFELRAHTVVYDALLPDEERRYSTMAAAALGIPVTHHAGDGHRLYERFDQYQARFPEPFHGPDLSVGFDTLRAAAGHARVLLTGYDGDTLLNESPKPYFAWLLREGRLARLGLGVARYALAQGRAWPRSWRARPGGDAAIAPLPAWIDADLVARLSLRERWEQFHRGGRQAEGLRPLACARLADMMATTAMFDQYEAGVTGLALECRHPFLDLRLVEFCLSLPPEPWCVRKAVLRAAMKGWLPPEILARPKTPLSGWAGQRLLGRPESRWIDGFVPAPRLDRFVERRRIPVACGNPRELEAWADLRPLTLNFWLQRLQPSRIATEDVLHESA